MMKVNFFANEYKREPIKSDSQLGICDPAGELCAYTTTDKNNENKWCATIHNPQQKELLFIAIDKNMVTKRENGDLESTCDGMIYLPQTRELSFVELKDYHVGGWMSGAFDQLISTLTYFNANHNYKDFKNRCAYACNPRHPRFQFSARESITEFRKRTHFRLMPQAVIKI